MAIVREVAYPEGITPSTVLETIEDMYEWEKIETTDEGVKLWVNDRTYLLIMQGTYSVGLKLYFNGNLVGTKMGDSTTIGNNYNSIYVVKTNVATTIQFTSSSNSKTTPSESSAAFIFSNGTNRQTGEIEKVASAIGGVSFANPKSTFICSKENMASDCSFDSGVSSKSGSALTTLTPFASIRSRVTLNDVYLVSLAQVTSMYRGECTLNGRKYFMIGLIMILDE